jgi:hypothetical protein
MTRYQGFGFDKGDGQQNRRRTDMGKHLLDLYAMRSGTDREDQLTDVLADLMHMAKQTNSEFNEQLSRARRNFNAEVKENE